jgi:hypothetical protein
VLPRLSSLDLSRGTFDDAAAQTLRRLTDRFRHLGQLDVSRNYLSDRGVWLVREVVPNALVDHQQDAGFGNDRYVSVGE